MEEWVGKLWHRWITKAAGGHYPDAAVALKTMERPLAIFFRALGGDAGLRVAAATADVPGSRAWDIGGPDVLEYGDMMQIYAEVAGYGPPWTMADATSTPVGQPHQRRRPARSSSTGTSSVTASASVSVP